MYQFFAKMQWTKFAHPSGSTYSPVNLRDLWHVEKRVMPENSLEHRT